MEIISFVLLPRPFCNYPFPFLSLESFERFFIHLNLNDDLVLIFLIRLKKIQEKKKIIKEKKELLRLALKAKGLEPDEAPNLIDDDRDEDLLFNN